MARLFRGLFGSDCSSLKPNAAVELAAKRGGLTNTPHYSERDSEQQKGIPVMIIGDRLRELREAKKLSQGDIEKRTGLLRCYISRVENGHTVPGIETLERMARALEIPLYQLFHDGKESPVLPSLLERNSSGENVWGSSGKDARFLRKFRRLLSKANEEDRKLVLYMAQKMARR